MTKYTVTDYSGNDIYYEGYDCDEAYKVLGERRKAMDAYMNEEEVTYDDIQEMTDEERKELYKAETGDELDVIDDEFWDWAEENFDY